MSDSRLPPRVEPQRQEALKFCSCGAYYMIDAQFYEHLKLHPDHYGINKTRWKALIESSQTPRSA
jgi:hypothetical protein